MVQELSKFQISNGQLTIKNNQLKITLASMCINTQLPGNGLAHGFR